VIALFSALVLLTLVLILVKYLTSKGDVAIPANKKLTSEKMPYFRKNLLTETELILMRRLQAAYPEHYVFSQVQLSQFLGIPRGSDHMSWLNRINRMSADFIVCDAAANPLVVIELDDKSHDRKDRIEADAKKDRAIASAGIKMARIRAESIPDKTALMLLLNV